MGWLVVALPTYAPSRTSTVDARNPRRGAASAPPPPAHVARRDGAGAPRHRARGRSEPPGAADRRLERAPGRCTVAVPEPRYFAARRLLCISWTWARLGSLDRTIGTECTP